MEQGNTLDHREDEETRKGAGERKGNDGDVLDEKPETGKKDDRKTDPGLVPQ